MPLSPKLVSVEPSAFSLRSSASFTRWLAGRLYSIVNRTKSLSPPSGAAVIDPTRTSLTGNPRRFTNGTASLPSPENVVSS